MSRNNKSVAKLIMHLRIYYYEPLFKHMLGGLESNATDVQEQVCLDSSRSGVAVPSRDTPVRITVKGKGGGHHLSWVREGKGRCVGS